MHALLDRFNPRTREGCDEMFALQNTEEQSFNPRTREGCDGRAVGLHRSGRRFQSTHP